MPKGNTISKKQVIAPAIAAALVLAIAPAILSTGAYAIEPTRTTKDRGMQFTDVDLTVNKETDDDGRVTSASLSATFEVTGSGTGGTATLSTTAVVVQGCINQGGNDPRGLQRDRVREEASEPFDARAGRGGGTVSTDPITVGVGGFSCPSANMTPVLVSVDFTNIELEVTSSEGKSITATFANQDP